MPSPTDRPPGRPAAGGPAATPDPPYVAVIFTSVQSTDTAGYAEMSAEMEDLARDQAGYLGIECARDGLGITVSYWADQDAARAWKQVARHLVAQRLGRQVWYSDYRVRVATVHRDYGPSGPRRHPDAAGGGYR